MTFPYSPVTSLGADCQVGWQLRQHFREPIPSPFDWMVTPLHSLRASLLDRGSKSGRSVSIIDALPPYAEQSVLCNDYGYSYHHDFPHNDSGLVQVTPEALTACRSKMLHKWKSFFDLTSACESLLFVRLGSFRTPPFAWVYLEEKEAIKVSEINALALLLEEIFPEKKIKLLQVLYETISPLLEDELHSQNVDIRFLPLPEKQTWQGDNEQWKKVFQDYSDYNTK